MCEHICIEVWTFSGILSRIHPLAHTSWSFTLKQLSLPVLNEMHKTINEITVLYFLEVRILSRYVLDSIECLRTRRERVLRGAASL